MAPKHVPERTCVGCRQVRAKRELVRVVRGPDGQLSLDPTGKAPGRGAYLGPARECLAKALEHGALERALNVTLSDAQREALVAEMYPRRATCPWHEEDSMSS